jgi:hypothetical protein
MRNISDGCAAIFSMHFDSSILIFIDSIDKGLEKKISNWCNLHKK